MSNLATRQVPEGTSSGTSRGKVLVVDDNPVTVAMLEKFLKNKGYQVVSATDAVQALNADLPFVPDVVLMDVIMPHLSGIELTRMLKTGMSEHDIRVIILTSLQGDEHRQKALAAGADAFLTKPVQPSKLLEAVREQVAGTRAGKAIRELGEIIGNESLPAGERVRALIATLHAHGLLDE